MESKHVLSHARQFKGIVQLFEELSHLLCKKPEVNKIPGKITNTHLRFVCWQPASDALLTLATVLSLRESSRFFWKGIAHGWGSVTAPSKRINAGFARYLFLHPGGLLQLVSKSRHPAENPTATTRRFEPAAASWTAQTWHCAGTCALPLSWC